MSANPPTSFRILVLGGYGLFGARIVRALARERGCELVVAGRDLASAQALCAELAAAGAQAGLAAAALDVTASDLGERIAALAPRLVIHSAGPFQGRAWEVAECALAARAHYVDLADARAFVAGFAALDGRARAAGCWAISGASSVPGLSGAVLAALAPRFGRLEQVATAISPGNHTPRGLATTRAILGQVGRPLAVLRDGRWQRRYGWQSLRRLRIAGLRTRWLACCDVPDLTVLPRRWPQLQSCEFRAGLELRRMHLGLWLASWLVRARLWRDLAAHAQALLALSQRWQALGSDVGVMQMDLRGHDHAGAPLHLRWRLLAHHGDGPQVPATAAVVLARKLARGRLPGSGARACLDLFTLDELLAELADYAIDTSVQQLT